MNEVNDPFYVYWLLSKLSVAECKKTNLYICDCEMHFLSLIIHLEHKIFKNLMDVPEVEIVSDNKT